MGATVETIQQLDETNFGIENSLHNGNLKRTFDSELLVASVRRGCALYPVAGDLVAPRVLTFHETCYTFWQGGDFIFQDPRVSELDTMKSSHIEVVRAIRACLSDDSVRTAMACFK